MSIWYDVKKKIYASSPNDNWYISYIRKTCDKLHSTLSARITNHTSAAGERHTAGDIDYSDGVTLKEAIENEVLQRKNDSNANSKKLEKAVDDLTNDFKNADSSLKEDLLNTLRTSAEETQTALQTFDKAKADITYVNEKNDAVLTEISGLESTASDTNTALARLNYYGDKDIVPTDGNCFKGELIFATLGSETTNAKNVWTITGLTANATRLNELVIPYHDGNWEIEIGTSAFSDNTDITSVILPKGTVAIGAAAFKKCTNLKNAVLPKTINKIKSRAFAGCTSLEHIFIPDSVTAIEDEAFAECENLTIRCAQGSLADTYAKENGINVEYTEVKGQDVKNELPGGALEVETVYDLGVQRTLNLTLPKGEVGDSIRVDFMSGITTTTITVAAEDDTEVLNTDFEIKGSKVYSLTFDYGLLKYDISTDSPIYGWRAECIEYDSGQSYSWADIQTIVRSGNARKYLEIGDTLSVNKNDEEIKFDVIGFDHDNPTDTSLTHSITLQLHDLFSSDMAYDTPEAMLAVDADTYPEGLPAGTYSFVWGTTVGSMLSGTYEFTISQSVPVGGQIVIEANGSETAVTDCKIATYAVAGSAIKLESDIAITPGSDGTSLGTISNNSASAANINCGSRIIFGSNNWSNSTIRQWLNTDGAADTWWEAKSVFDRPASITAAGFLKGIDPAFLAVVCDVYKTTQKSISDGYGLDTTTERFFILSRAEVYGGAERKADGEDGTVYEYYDVARSDLSAPGTDSDSNRTKYRSGSSTYWWLRTSYNDVGNNVRVITPAGAVGHRAPNFKYNTGIAPACVIA